VDRLSFVVFGDAHAGEGVDDATSTFLVPRATGFAGGARGGETRPRGGGETPREAVAGSTIARLFRDSETVNG